MKLKFIVPALLAGLVAFTSCSKEDKKEEKKDPYEGLRNLNVPAGQEREIKYLDASNNEGKYVYFSFNKGVVEVNDPMASNDWDIAFNRYHVKTNSGTSGKGQGGAVRTEGKDFAALKTASTTGYLADIEKEVSSFAGGKGGNQKISLAPALDPGHGYSNSIDPKTNIGAQARIYKYKVKGNEKKIERAEVDKLPQYVLDEPEKWIVNNKELDKYRTEHILALRVSRKMEELLTKKGFECYLTRNNETVEKLVPESAIWKRIDFANEKNADYFISIHADGSEGYPIGSHAIYTNNLDDTLSK